jgi:sulfur transfer protein SufE
MAVVCVDDANVREILPRVTKPVTTYGFSEGANVRATNVRADDGKMHFTADSDAIITKGIIGLLIRVLDGEEPKDIATADLFFISKIGLQEHLSPTRANGLLGMVKRLKLEAIKHISAA